jgi:hypothetical protein
MKTKERRKYYNEQFKKILPSLNQLIHSVRLTDKVEKHIINGAEFLIRLNKDVIEMSLANEKHIFPTLAYRHISDTVDALLYYRITDDFTTELCKAVFSKK